MERRSFLRGGLGLGVAAAAGVASDRRLAAARPLVPSPRSSRPEGGWTGRLDTRVVWHADAAQQQVALTFDDGADPRFTPLVLDLLARHRVPATFYVVGSRAQARRDLLARAVGSGHEVGNHTWTHADLCLLGPAQVREQLHRTSELLERLTGTAPATLRPPWGHVDAAGLRAAAEMDCTVVLWSELVRAVALEADLARTLDEVRPGSVVLAHDGGPTPTVPLVQAVDRLVGALRERGHTFTTVSGLLGGSPARAAATNRATDVSRTVAG